MAGLVAVVLNTCYSGDAVKKSATRLSWASRWLPILLLVPVAAAQVNGPVPVPASPQTRNPSDPGSIPPPPLPTPRLPRIPMPRLPRIPGTGDRQAKTPPPGQTEFLEFTGTLKSVSSTLLTVEDARRHERSFRCTAETRFLRRGETLSAADLRPGLPLLVEAREDEAGRLFAFYVHVRGDAGPPATPEREPDEKKPENKKEEDEDGTPPILRRKEAPFSRSAASDPELIEEARQEVYRFSETLPRYICDQITTRYRSGSRKGPWRKQDVLRAEVLSVDGEEQYQNIRRGRQEVSMGQVKATGSWSKGEFESTLRDIFSPATGAAFVGVGQDRVGSFETRVFAFEVAQERSHWKTEFGGQTAFPPYRGKVWIDASSARVVRIEMESIEMPPDFPVTGVEWRVEYATVRIDNEPYLLPVAAANASCFRVERQCAKNELVFENYRRFTAEANVFTTDTQVDFELPKKK